MEKTKKTNKLDGTGDSPRFGGSIDPTGAVSACLRGLRPTSPLAADDDALFTDPDLDWTGFRHSER